MKEKICFVGHTHDLEITQFDGKEINDASDLHDLVTEIEEQKEVELEILRDGKKIKLKAKKIYFIGFKTGFKTFE